MSENTNSPAESAAPVPDKPAEGGKDLDYLATAQEIARAVPALDAGGAGGGFGQIPKAKGRPPKPDHLLKWPRKKPLKNKVAGNLPGFGEIPPAPEASATAEPAGNIVPVDFQQPEAAPVVTAEEWAELGNLVASMHLDLYALKDEEIIALARTKLEKSLLDRLVSVFVVEGRIKENLAKGYAAGLESLNVPPSVVRGGVFIHAAISLHRLKKAQWEEARDLLKALPSRTEAAAS